MNEVYTCRICLEEENDCKNLVSPCKCKGTQKYIHKECLKRMTKHWDNCPTCDSVISNNKHNARYSNLLAFLLISLIAVLVILFFPHKDQNVYLMLIVSYIFIVLGVYFINFILGNNPLF